MQRVVVIDYRMGNLRSVAKALAHVAGERAEILVSSDPGVIGEADRVVFPGQGAIRDCMLELNEHGLVEAVKEAVASKPFLGICLGQQALMESSEEHAGTAGLGIFPGTVKRFSRDARDEATGARLKVPHMGWNDVRFVKAHPLWRGIDDGEYFYFVHSYYVAPRDDGVIVGRTRYAVEFSSAIAQRNLFAVQFHPEKSARAGLTLLENYLEWNGKE
ncbi:MAG TPA: imidazole glycerol phosphate synthase subunit HisH [Gammaproteobacteria bacterium]|nr:imidazole glycerol phosphate synthase subunit HisH [Gammaproteobacteria bacterium]